MAVQIIPRTGGAAGFGGDLGSAIGSGLSSGIQNLANAKLQKITQQHEYGKKVRGLEALGIKDADKLAHLDDETLQLVMKEKIQEPGRQAYANALQSTLGGEQQQISTQTNNIPDEIRNITPEQKRELAQYLVSPEASQQYKPEELEKLAKYLTTGEGLNQNQQSTNKPSQPTGLNEKQATELAKLGLEKKKTASKEKAEAFKFTEAYNSKVAEEARAKKQENKILDRIIKLSEEGDIRDPVLSESLEKLGLDFKGLMSGDTTELKKLESFFLRGASSLFGGKVSNQEMQQLLASVPTLLNSKEGRIQIAKQMKLANESSFLEDKVRREIIKENGGVPPFDIRDQVAERMGPEEERLAEEFINASLSKSKQEKVAKTFEKLPSATEYSGKRIRFPDGSIRKSNGKEWVKE